MLTKALCACIWFNTAAMYPATLWTQADQAAKALTESAPSQEGSTLLRGMVVDHTGSIVPNFAVEIQSVTSADSGQQNTVPSPLLKVQTNHEGEFFASLSSGSYEVCVARFPNSCRRIVVEKPPKPLDYLRLEIHPWEDHASSALLDAHIRRLAGPNAVDCGRVERKDNPRRATACALHAYKHHKAFYVRYDPKGVGDSEVANGFAGDASGKVYFVMFDSMGLNDGHLPPGAIMPDGFHTIIYPCSQPARLHVSHTTGELDCLAYDRSSDFVPTTKSAKESQNDTARIACAKLLILRSLRI